MQYENVFWVDFWVFYCKFVYNKINDFIGLIFGKYNWCEFFLDDKVYCSNIGYYFGFSLEILILELCCKCEKGIERFFVRRVSTWNVLRSGF